MLETNPLAGSPNPQLLVDAFASHADHLADLLLGNGDGSVPRRELVFLGQTNEGAGKPAWQVLKNNLFDLVAGPPQLRAEQLDEFSSRAPDGSAQKAKILDDR